MTKKTRLIILAICVILFFIVTPYILLYSLGYRINFKERTITATGGIYVRAAPLDADIFVDSKLESNPGLFSNTVFVQNLLPAPHEVMVKKDGYHEYHKKLQVKENEVTKLENVQLFKENITFSTIGEDRRFSGVTETIWSGNAEKALIKIGVNYYLVNIQANPLSIAPVPYLSGATQPLFNPQDSSEIFFIKTTQGGKNVYSGKRTAPIIEDIIAYTANNSEMLWLARDGFLYSQNYPGGIIAKISSEALLFKKKSAYALKVAGGHIFLLEDEKAFLLGSNSKNFEPFYSNVRQILASPNRRHILYANEHEVLYSLVGQTSAQEDLTLVQHFSEKIKDIQWLNDDYVILILDEKVVISEIDPRGNVNAFTLPLIVPLEGGQTLSIENPKIFFNYRDKKLYILSQNTLVVSEKLIP